MKEYIIKVFLQLGMDLTILPDWLETYIIGSIILGFSISITISVMGFLINLHDIRTKKEFLQIFAILLSVLLIGITAPISIPSLLAVWFGIWWTKLPDTEEQIEDEIDSLDLNDLDCEDKYKPKRRIPKQDNDYGYFQ